MNTFKNISKILTVLGFYPYSIQSWRLSDWPRALTPSMIDLS